MIDIPFVVPIVPRGQPSIRARAFIDPATKKPVASTYQPKEAAQWKSDLAVYAEQFRPAQPIDAPIRLDLLAVMPRPKSKMRRADPPGLIECLSKPDIDNIRKAVQDALKTWWRDDALICAGQSLKAYAEKDGFPRLVLRVRSPVNVAQIAMDLGLATRSSGAPAAQGEFADLPLLQHALEQDDEHEERDEPDDDYADADEFELLGGVG